MRHVEPSRRRSEIGHRKARNVGRSSPETKGPRSASNRGRVRGAGQVSRRALRTLRVVRRFCISSASSRGHRTTHEVGVFTGREGAPLGFLGKAERPLPCLPLSRGGMLGIVERSRGRRWVSRLRTGTRLPARLLTSPNDHGHYRSAGAKVPVIENGDTNGPYPQGFFRRITFNRRAGRARRPRPNRYGTRGVRLRASPLRTDRLPRSPCSSGPRFAT